MSYCKAKRQYLLTCKVNRYRLFGFARQYCAYPANARRRSNAGGVLARVIVGDQNASSIKPTLRSYEAFMAYVSMLAKKTPIPG